MRESGVMAIRRLLALPALFLYDRQGKLVKSFAAGMIIFPHGIHVDREGNVWLAGALDGCGRAACASATDERATSATRVMTEPIRRRGIWNLH